jgi:hypothetical protein
LKTEQLQLAPGQFINASRDANGRAFVAYNRGVSVWLRHPAELRRFFKLRSGQAKRRWLDQWLEELAASDAAKARPAGPEQDPALLKAAGFGPEHHQA